jgi:hypothetical protein
MFKTLLGALNSAITLLSSDTGLVGRGLAGLAEIDPALAARAAAFVAEGTGEAVLLELQAHAPKAGDLLGAPGRLYYGWYAHSSPDDAAAKVKAGLAARNELYQRVALEPAAVALLARLGKVLEAADRGKRLDRTGSSAPDWLQYLLNDALAASIDTHAGQAGSPDRPAWDVRLLRAILDDAGLPGAMALPIVFERREVSHYHLDNVYKRLLAPGALDDDMLSHPDDVAFAAKTLSASGKVLLANRIGTSSALRDRYAGLLVRLAVGDGKTVRAAAARHLDALDRTLATGLLDEALRGGQTEERSNAAEALARLQGPAAAAILEAALAQEAGKPVQQAIRAALSRIQAATDAAAVELPEPPPLPPFEETRLGAEALELLLDNRVQLLEQLRRATEAEEERNRTATHKWDWQRKHYDTYRGLTENQLRTALLALNGETRAFGVLADRSVDETLAFGGRLEARADYGLVQALRWQLHGTGSGYDHWTHPRFQAWLRRQDPAQVDLRQIEEIATRFGAAPGAFAARCLQHSWNPQLLPQAVLPPERVWPCLVQYPALIDEGLGMTAQAERGRYNEFDLGQTLSVLATFPALPSRWLPRVMELALGEGKTHRMAAQRVLDSLPDIGRRVCEALESNRQELRIEAARWLARLGDRAGLAAVSLPALNAALDKETRETVSAELMTALEKLGQDLSPRLAPAILLKQARKGLKAKPPAGLAWFPFEQLPACAWQDGDAVDPDIIRWWIILAARLKEPAANALLERYLGLLDPASRAALGRFVLLQFIAHDTRHPPLEEAMAHAALHAPARYQSYQQWARQHPQYYEAQGKLTPEQVFEEVKREKLAEYLGSAIGEKGILALSFGAPGHETVAAIQQYMRDHYPRRTQIEAMLEAAAVSRDPAVIQLMLSVARRYRTASVQQKARELVERIAERNGWTQDELADRTVPTAGLDESGQLTLQYGTRAYTVVLDASLKLVLRNSEGKPVSALPAPRQDDPPGAIKEAKQQLSASKKELKQVLDLQQARLYEAMCAGRTWPAAEWEQFVRRHPVVGRLAQRLLWARLGEDGKAIALFRPAEDGSLINADDDEVELPADARVAVAHATMLDDGQVRAWQAHFKDYKVSPLFAQLGRRLPPFEAGARLVNDRLGWTSDTFTLRNAFGKAGYQRGAAEDGGVFFEYTKDFAAIGIRVSIEFSGSQLPEENMPAALKTLGFQPLSARAGFGPLQLDKIPPVLLAEAWADYHAVSAACAFDPEWERKMPW